MAGQIIGVYTADKGRRPVGHESVSVVASKGIAGDRYFKGQGTFSEKLKQKRKREITFIAAEEIDRFNETQVPANRIGYTEYNIGELKMLQEVITLTVFVPIAVLYLKQPLRLDYLWAALCILGAVYFAFRGHVPAH